MQEAKKGRGHGVIAETGQMDRAFALNTRSNPAKKGRKRCAIAETGKKGQAFHLQNVIKSGKEGKDAVS